jgi:hypothetical protein
MDKDEKPKKNKQAGDSEVENSINQPFPIEPSEPEPTGDTPKNHTNGKKDKGNSNRRLFWVNVGMLLAFIVVNYFLIDNSNENIKLAEKSLVIGNAAYIVVMADTTASKFGGIFHYIVRFHNFGHTPAIKVSYRVNFEYFLVSEKKTKRIDTAYNDDMIIPPQLYSFVPYEVFLADIPMNKEIDFMTSGSIEYDDIFNHRYRIDFTFKFSAGEGRFVVIKENGYKYKQLY